ncbi:hypothetical protein [Myxococcus landrumensis]|uniref:Uncharacterized protein n=1 Tax=Myxococcus landrumensis TaxID=2813577 RepID=A0ABX7N6J3_9BACT|nr:hypothetical protein [Myxococcus landrumus]QSQ14034.1 hypothetical protein JY572_37930 [Myxococcus landrumus]
MSGTTISSAWANNTLGDISTELTNSLDRQGRGGMLAPLKLVNGSSAAPSISWTSDPDSGIYRAGAGDIRMQVDSAQAQTWTAAGSTISVPLSVATISGNTSVTGALAVGGTSTFAQPSTFALGISSTGPTTAPGVAGFGGSSSGDGLRGQGGAPNGHGVVGTSAGTGVGVVAVAGTAATATVPRNAAQLINGNLDMGFVTSPNSNVAFTDVLTPKNIVKAWARILIPMAGGVAITEGFNVSSVSASTTTATLTFASAFANTNYAVVVTSGSGAPYAYYSNVTGTTTVQIKARNLAAGAIPLPERDFTNASGSDTTFHVVAIGDQ